MDNKSMERLWHFTHPLSLFAGKTGKTVGQYK